jgi:hypothetical protein
VTLSTAFFAVGEQTPALQLMCFVAPAVISTDACVAHALISSAAIEAAKRIHPFD